MQQSLFISCASSDFRSLRPQIAQQLRMPFQSVVHQEDFKAAHGTLLEKIDLYLRDTQLVVHLVGTHAGDGPTRVEVDSLLES